MGPWTSHPLPGTPSVTLHPLVQERWAPQPTTARQVPPAISLSVPRLLEGWAHLLKGADPFWRSLDMSGLSPLHPKLGAGVSGGTWGGWTGSWKRGRTKEETGEGSRLIPLTSSFLCRKSF